MTQNVVLGGVSKCGGVNLKRHSATGADTSYYLRGAYREGEHVNYIPCLYVFI